MIREKSYKHLIGAMHGGLTAHYTQKTKTRMRDNSSTNTGSSEGRSPNHWTAREFQGKNFSDC